MSPRRAASCVDRKWRLQIASTTVTWRMRSGNLCAASPGSAATKMDHASSQAATGRLAHRKLAPRWQGLEKLTAAVFIDDPIKVGGQNRLAKRPEPTRTNVLSWDAICPRPGSPHPRRSTAGGQRQSCRLPTPYRNPYLAANFRAPSAGVVTVVVGGGPPSIPMSLTGLFDQGPFLGS